MNYLETMFITLLRRYFSTGTKYTAVIALRNKELGDFIPQTGARLYFLSVSRRACGAI